MGFSQVLHINPALSWPKRCWPVPAGYWQDMSQTWYLREAIRLGGTRVISVLFLWASVVLCPKAVPNLSTAPALWSPLNYCSVPRGSRIPLETLQGTVWGYLCWHSALKSNAGGLSPQMLRFECVPKVCVLDT
jgi:hypothetical protein